MFYLIIAFTIVGFVLGYLSGAYSEHKSWYPLGEITLKTLKILCKEVDTFSEAELDILDFMKERYGEEIKKTEAETQTGAETGE